MMNVYDVMDKLIFDSDERMRDMRLAELITLEKAILIQKEQGY